CHASPGTRSPGEPGWSWGEGGFSRFSWRRAPLRSSSGFTILELLIVLSLAGIVMAVTVPRITLGDDLSTTGRKLIGTLRTLQRMAEVGQKPVKLYLDLDRGTYWAMVVDGREERRPFDAAWASPLSLPEKIRMTEISVRGIPHTYGLAELVFFPNGRLEPATISLSDTDNNLLMLMIDHLTGNVKTFDRRPEPSRPQPIPDRVKVLLQAASPQT
ncbi:MAG: type II secretion system GspH family protein, partial [Nitrospira sp.]|nr:type II secretion system GspH family protein [Nitrospira sp.]